VLLFSTDKPRLKRHFEKDPVLFSYHLGDLDDFFFGHCQWAVVYEEERAKIAETILIYSGGKIPSVQAFGMTSAFNDLLSEAVDILPKSFYGHFKAVSESVFLTRYEMKPLGRHLKMKLGVLAGEAVNNESAHLLRLDRSHLSLLTILYDKAYPENYFTERMLESGKYFGAFVDSRLVAVAGVHVDSAEYKTAVLGNIAVNPDFRGRGFGKLVTARLVRELVDEEKIVCLNVKEDNGAAIRIYESLGFTKVHEYVEAFFERRV